MIANPEDMTAPGAETPRLLAFAKAKDLRRFTAKIKQDGECWIWTAYCDGKGYGQFWYNGLMRWAHRWSYAAFVAMIPSGETIDHTCCNPSCVNPAHLRPLSRSENTARGNQTRHEEVPF